MSNSFDLHVDEKGLSPSSDRRTATRADILDAVSAHCPGLSRSQLREVFEMTLEEVADTLANGESVKLRSFGLFTVRAKRERIGRNPRTGVEVPIKPRRVLTFRPSPVLLEAVNRANPSATAANSGKRPGKSAGARTSS